MAYLGKVDMNDANIKHYSLTGSTATTVDIGWVPPSEQSLRVTINGVVQQGGTFSLSGSNLTLGGALVATDDLEVVGIQSVGNLITPADNSVSTAKLADDAVTLAKMADGTQGGIIHYGAAGAPVELAAGTDGYFLKTQGAGANPVWASAGGDNTPSFGAYLSANQGLSNDTWTKITMNTEEWDTDSAFDHSTNYRFTVPSGEAGKYVFSVTTTYDDTGGTTAVGDGRLAIYKTPSGGSASAFKQIWWGKDIAARANYLGVMLTAVIDLAVGDAIEFYGYMNQNASSGVAMGGQSYTFCSGYKLL